MFSKMIAPFFFLPNDRLWRSTGKETDFDFYKGNADKQGCVGKRVTSASGWHSVRVCP